MFYRSFCPFNGDNRIMHGNMSYAEDVLKVTVQKGHMYMSDKYGTLCTFIKPELVS